MLDCECMPACARLWLHAHKPLLSGLCLTVAGPVVRAGCVAAGACACKLGAVDGWVLVHARGRGHAIGGAIGALIDVCKRGPHSGGQQQIVRPCSRIARCRVARNALGAHMYAAAKAHGHYTASPSTLKTARPKTATHLCRWSRPSGSHPCRSRCSCQRCWCTRRLRRTTAHL